MFSRIWAVYEDGGLLAMCSWCGRVRLGDDWLFAPRAALVAIDERSVISHSICKECADRFDPAPLSPRHTLRSSAVSVGGSA